MLNKTRIETVDGKNMIFLPLLQFAALTSEDVWAAAAVFEELRLLFPIRVRRDGGVGGGWKKRIKNIEGASTFIVGTACI